MELLSLYESIKTANVCTLLYSFAKT